MTVVFPLSPLQRLSSTIAQRPTAFINHSTLKFKSKAKKIRGRGGKTKRGGRGNKGYKARNAKSSRVPAFAGGQTRIVKAFPKFGRQSNVFA